jgi:alpha-D-ribose 1-methylphosphonate 5-triphosphate synthase subunit PhnI
MRAERRISATFKDIPGGQQLGPTYDYTHRLLDFTLLANGEETDSSKKLKTHAAYLEAVDQEEHDEIEQFPHILDLLNKDGLIEPPTIDEHSEPADITQVAPSYPAGRSARLQGMVRGDEGFLLALAYSSQRGYGRNHAFAGEIRSGEIQVSFMPEELGFEVDLGDIVMTECEMVNQFVGSKKKPAQFTRGYGVSFGFAERKAMSMAMVDRAMRFEELGETADSPVQDQEFVMSHCDNVEAVGFVSHLKLPHYVDFQSELELVRKMRAAAEQGQLAGGENE